MAENENQQYMQNFWDNDSFVFMMLLLKCQLWLDERRVTSPWEHVMIMSLYSGHYMRSRQFGLLHRNFLYIGGSASHMSCFSLLYFYILEVR